MGVQLSVDDVGTNWSSFEPFKRNSISTVKIDGSFIAGLESTQGINRLVVETVIHMAHSLGMSTIVEWVETAAQVEIVRAFNADAAQGFFFSRPMSSDDAVAFTGGPEVPQFSCTEVRTLIVSRPGLDASMLLGGHHQLDPGRVAMAEAPVTEETARIPAAGTARPMTSRQIPPPGMRSGWSPPIRPPTRPWRSTTPPGWPGTSCRSTNRATNRATRHIPRPTRPDCPPPPPPPARRPPSGGPGADGRVIEPNRAPR